MNFADAATYCFFERALVVVVNATVPGVRQNAMKVERRSFMLVLCWKKRYVYVVSTCCASVEYERSFNGENIIQRDTFKY